MGSVERLRDTGTRRAEHWLRELGEECRHARLRLGASQREVADAARLDRGDYSRFERGKLPSVTVVTAGRITSVLGLDLWIRAFPGGRSIRDAGQARRLQSVLARVAKPLGYRIEVPLPAVGDRAEKRAWDAVLFGSGERTGLEFETRLHDLQAQKRRWELKRRDDPVDHLLVVAADTRGNRRVLADFADLLAELPRLPTETVLATLQAGRHPPTGLILLHAPDPRRQGLTAARSRSSLAG